MLITRLYLRNFRVYEDELDLALPPGLVGIYGANGAGKSTLLEAITFTLWGKARTGREEVRSSGVGGECVTELTFEHEGHIYVVRRSLSGINATMKAEAHCDGFVMAEGATDTRRYVQSILGMDDLAFKSSVFAEQKQLAAFSSKAPADRRKLVLQLLGITPLDGARDAARRDARDAEQQLSHLKGVLPNLDELAVTAADADAKAAAAETVMAEEKQAAETAALAAADALAIFERQDKLRQAYDGLVIEGRAARDILDRETQSVADLTAELGELETAAASLDTALAAAAGLDDDRAALEAVKAVLTATTRLTTAEAALPPPPSPADPQARDDALTAAQVTRDALATLDGQITQTTAELDRARQAAERSGSLSGEADCPLCGQALGDAFAQVQEHRAAEVHDAAARLELLREQRGPLVEAVSVSAAAVKEAERALAASLAAQRAWEQGAAARDAAAATLESARAALGASPLSGGASLSGTASLSGGPSFLGTPEESARLEAQVAAKTSASREALTLQGRLERRPALEASLRTARERAANAQTAVVGLREKVKSLAFDPAALAAATGARDATRATASGAAEHARKAELEAVGARRDAQGEAKRLADGQAQHAQLADLTVRARHLTRLAALLSEFRNTVVSTVGPRLAAQAAELFGELTDREYDQLEVDPETYELKISDGGHSYGLDRFSGSEIDLANLALRVAISEHVRFQSGGSVGLLVLDEVFGPLDEDRKTRMLQALEQLRGRFRQVLVVTHDATIKDQLPNAIEVIKRPGRRATARVMGA